LLPVQRCLCIGSLMNAVPGLHAPPPPHKLPKHSSTRANFSETHMSVFEILEYTTSACPHHQTGRSPQHRNETRGRHLHTCRSSNCRACRPRSDCSTAVNHCMHASHIANALAVTVGAVQWRRRRLTRGSRACRAARACTSCITMNTRA
jgi:hypothetical protein